eukprot:1158032-Pelagomonas_calceolata.AAC.14
MQQENSGRMQTEERTCGGWLAHALQLQMTLMPCSMNVPRMPLQETGICTPQGKDFGMARCQYRLGAEGRTDRMH